MHKLSLVLLACLIHTIVYGQVDIPEDDVVHITSKISYFVDTTGLSSLADIRQEDAGFRPAPKNGLRLTNVEGSLWLKLELLNHDDQNKESILTLDDPSLYKIILYEEGEEPSLGGTAVKQEDRDVQGKHNAFVISTAALSSETLYFKVESPNFITATASLYDPDLYYKQESKEFSFLGVFYGILMLVAIYALFSYALTRMKLFLLYAIYIVVSMLFTGMLDGFTPMYLNGLVELFRGYLEFVLAGVANVIALLFTAAFLRTKYWSVRLHNILRGTGFSLLGSILIIMIISPGFGFEFMRMLSIPIVLLILTAAALAFKKGIEQSGFFLWAFMTYGFFILIFSLSMFRVIPFSLFANYTLHIGIILNVLILSFALSFRIFRNYKSSYDEIELTNELYSLKNIELEQLVWERTKEVIYKENELRSIIDNSDNHIWLIDTDYALRETNKSFAEAWVFSYGRELIKGKNILEQVAIPEHRTLWKSRYDEVFEGKRTSFTDRYPIEGVERIFEINAFPIREDDKVVAAAIFSRDITERILYQDQLEEKNVQLQKANEELDSFVYSASHDLKAPLASIQGLIGLARGEKEMEQLQTYFEMMERSVRRLDQFIRDIIDYSRNSRVESKIQVIEVCTLLQSILDDLKFMNPSDTTQIILKNPEKYVPLVSDEVRLRVILRNLISNALTYGKPENSEPVVEIRWAVDEKKAIFEVSDNGPGIDDEHLPHIFDMFYRANETAAGSGLGLYIVKESLNKLGGEIMVDSTPKDGSTFTVILSNNSEPA